MRRRLAPRPSGVVSLLTDFGLDDAYVGTVKGVILSINPRARLVDLTHAVPPQDVRRGALLLEQAWVAFPPGTVHLAVVDPGVGTDRLPRARPPRTDASARRVAATRDRVTPRRAQRPALSRRAGRCVRVRFWDGAVPRPTAASRSTGAQSHIR
jgi:hypothetical protein